MAFQLTITGQTIRRILLGLLIGAVLGGLVWLFLILLEPDDPFADVVDERRYQAVFLVNGSVYFGKLSDASDELYELRQAFFIQEVPGEAEDAPTTQQVRPISTEFHQPENRMLITKSEVVLIENLLPDSEVAAAIDRVLAEGG